MLSVDRECGAGQSAEISNTTVIGWQSIVVPKADGCSRDGCGLAYISEKREKAYRDAINVFEAFVKA